MRTIFAIIFVILIMILSGYTFTVLWSWFIVPQFNISELSIPSAIGISLLISYLTKDIDIKDDEYSFSDNIFKAAPIMVSKPIMALAIGYIVTLFI